MNEIEDFFDKLAPTWDELEETPTEFRDILIKKVGIKKGDKVIDIACGTGIVSGVLFEESGKQITAIDLSSKMIEIAKTKFNDEEVHFINDDFITHKFDKKFDVAVIYNAYPHFVDIDAFIKKLYEILDEHAKFAIIHSFSLEGLKNHHKNVKSTISREINSLEEEANRFKKYFMNVHYEDLPNSLYIIGEK